MTYSQPKQSTPVYQSGIVFFVAGIAENIHAKKKRSRSTAIMKYSIKKSGTQ